MSHIYMVITNNGDGSNGVEWVIDDKVIDRMEDLADDGDESYASGDGLQVNTLLFPDGFDIQAWIRMNSLSLTTIESMPR
jgi:hypothetical protein